ncbi:ethylbenzene dehydrogenase-related protein [Candidatus Venteria ishoeyi]|uniref:ethylbenzene dehydrogenase-related protein n=1 Tax=Candidatus Venteria ishoeyi TaxID=1899563 RepID=UPI0025A54CF0|nr:ethylbenzene dehydrogenase-related protein [Candidatus Venteria ishoeyi]MDM8546747.1 ethylbenzene dehydrogenase-related protein [Candidatus Venteria ishoeyi]
MKYPLTFLICLSAYVMRTASALTISIPELTSQPIVDGMDDDWSKVTAVNIPLHKTKADGISNVPQVQLKAGIYGDQVFFYMVWDDDSHDIMHKPFVWDDNQQKYITGPQREDRLALQFEMTGNYTTDWFSGQSFTADMWHWKAFRSNATGNANDKMTIISRQKLLRTYKGMAADGEPLYIQRPMDAGNKPYKTKRYRKKQQALMPKYIINEQAKGSMMDVKAKGIWKNGKWHLELSRKLNTGHDDDVVFVPGKAVKGGIAVFNHSESDDHMISDTLIFQFQNKQTE